MLQNWALKARSGRGMTTLFRAFLKYFYFVHNQYVPIIIIYLLYLCCEFLFLCFRKDKTSIVHVKHERIFESSATQQLKHAHYCTLFTFLSADSMPCRRWSGWVTARTSVGFSCWSPQDIYSAMHTPWLPLYGRLAVCLRHRQAYVHRLQFLDQKMGQCGVEGTSNRRQTALDCGIRCFLTLRITKCWLMD